MYSGSLDVPDAGSFPGFQHVLFGDFVDFGDSLTRLNLDVFFIVILGSFLDEVVNFSSLKQFSHLLEDKFHVFHVFVRVDN